MAMRETQRSLSIYFVVAGALGIVSAYMNLMSPESNVVAVVLMIPGIVFSGMDIYFGIRLKALLLNSANLIVWTLVASLIYLLALLVLIIALGDASGGGPLIIGALITGYLIQNVRRLAQETSDDVKA